MGLVVEGLVAGEVGEVGRRVGGVDDVLFGHVALLVDDLARGHFTALAFLIDSWQRHFCTVVLSPVKCQRNWFCSERIETFDRKQLIVIALLLLF